MRMKVEEMFKDGKSLMGTERVMNKAKKWAAIVNSAYALFASIVLLVPTCV